jgi:hypothetical protein
MINKVLNFFTAHPHKFELQSWMKIRPGIHHGVRIKDAYLPELQIDFAQLTHTHH